VAGPRKAGAAALGEGNDGEEASKAKPTNKLRSLSI
jgi:hypothetical protein